MSFANAKQVIEQKGWTLLAQSCHTGGMVSYDAVKGTGKWPHGRKLAAGEPRKRPHDAMTSLLRACIDRDLPRYRKRAS